MSDENRELGVELGDLAENLRDHDYPAGREELLEVYGEERIEFGEGEATFGELLEPLNQAEYDSYGEVEGAIMNMVGEAAIGRKYYSDRTPPVPGGEDQRGQDSF